MIDRPIKLGVPIREALSWVGILASQSRTQRGLEAARLCAEVAASFDEQHETTIEIPAVQVLCHLCDALRGRGELEAVSKIEQVIALLKDGQRTIVGAINLDGSSLSRLDDQYEALRKQIAR